MCRRQAAHVHPVAELDVAGQSCAIGHDDVVAQHAVMRDMRVRHEEVVAADARDALIVRGAAVYGAELAEYVLIADLKIGSLAAGTSCPADHCRWKRIEKYDF